MTKIIKVPTETVNQIQALQVEVESRKDLLAFMAEKGIGPSNETFGHYYREFQEFFVKYQAAKEQMEHDCLQPLAGGRLLNWTLDFATKEAVCEVAE